MNTNSLSYKIKGLNQKRYSIFLPSNRYNNLNRNLINKFSYLASHPSINGKVYGLPDLSDDKLGLSGTYFKAKERIFPLGAGFDIGCGYRLLNIKASKKKLMHIEDKIELFQKQICNHKPSLSISNQDINLMYTNLNNWLLKKGLAIDSDLKHNKENLKLNFVSKISRHDIAKSLGRIAPGNHFVEVREVTEIYSELESNKLNIEKGDILVLIHSGAGKKIEQTFLRYFAAMYNFCELETKIGPHFNGYKVNIPQHSDLGQQYIEEAMRSKIIAKANRQILTYLLRKWINNEINVLFDVEHDNVSVKGDIIEYQKGTQKFINYNGVSIAIIPGTISDKAILVKNNGVSNVINHGVGEGKDGKRQLLKNVITNLKTILDRQYYNIDQVIESGINAGFYTPILKADPWISIKNGGEW
jgi:RNA-splicing ligase RtcB